MSLPARLLLALTLGLVPAVAFAEDGAADAAPSAEAEPRATATAESVLEGLASEDARVRLAACETARDVAGSKVVAGLVKALGDKADTVRVAAIGALGARTEADDKKAAAAGLNKRLAAWAKSAESRPELDAALDALHDLAQVSSVKPLMDGIDLKTDADEAEARLMAVANVPDKEAIEALIKFRGKGRRRGSNGQQQLAHKALLYATGAKVQNDPDAWRAWWKEREKSFDFQAAADLRAETAQKRADREERKRERDEKKGGKRKDRDGGDEKDDAGE